MDKTLIRALLYQPTEYTPIWIMRQAGRYLPAYRKLRSKYKFLEMIYTPELAAQITLQPVEQIGVDAAIIFSDILVIPQAMGMDLEFLEDKGPVFKQPLRSLQMIDKLQFPENTGMLEPVYEAIRFARRELYDKVPLIGFAGAPWTLAAYMVEGKGSKTFRHTKEFLYTAPQAMRQLLHRLTEAIIDYLRHQIKAGAQAIQIFDSWAGQLTPEQFRSFSLPYLERIVQALAHTNVPIILFARGASHSLRELAAISADAVSIDWQTDLAQARQKIGDQVALQGNLDPAALYAPIEVLRQEVVRILVKHGFGPGHVFNLGHGIAPDVPVDHVRALVDFVHEISPKYHQYQENNSLLQEPVL